MKRLTDDQVLELLKQRGPMYAALAEAARLYLEEFGGSGYTLADFPLFASVQFERVRKTGLP